MDQQQSILLSGADEAACTLIGQYCAEHPDEKQIADWFSGIEFEALRPEVSCMAAAMVSENDYMGTPGELVPRLRGITRYVRTLNAGMTAGLCALGKQFNEAGIPAVLVGSTAVHLGYPNPPQRHMWQMEIGVLEADFPRAAALAEHAGFTVEQTPYSATARRGNTQCILVRKGMGYTQETTELTVNGVSFLMPSGAELIVSLAEAVFQVLSGTAPGAKLIPWIMDLHGLTAAVSDWDAVAAAADKRGTAAQVRLVLELYHALAAGSLTEEILSCFGTGDQTVRLTQLLLKYRKLNSGSSKLKRLWFSAQLKSEGSSFAALILFFKSARQALVRKFTRGS